MQQVFAIYDRKANTYSLPFFKPSEGDALRMFMQAAVDQQTTIYMYPSDYELYFIGEYTEDLGCFQNATPHFIIRGDQAQAKFAAYQRVRANAMKASEEEKIQEVDSDSEHQPS